MNSVVPFTISRIFDAPVALLYAVNTDSAHLAKWLSPEGFRTIHAAMDFRVGGTYHYGLEGPGGMQMWGKQEFRAIDPDREIVLLQSFSDADGGMTRHPMAAQWPLQMLATTSFERVNATQTRMTITWQPYESDDAGCATFDGARAGMEQGFAGTFAKLETYLASLH